jgi:1,4-alpha-glucan branching enzyme
MGVMNDNEDMLRYFKKNGIPFESVPAMHEAFTLLHSHDEFIVFNVNTVSLLPGGEKCVLWNKKNPCWYGLIYVNLFTGRELPLKNIRWAPYINSFYGRLDAHQITHFKTRRFYKHVKEYENFVNLQQTECKEENDTEGTGCSEQAVADTPTDDAAAVHRTLTCLPKEPAMTDETDDTDKRSTGAKELEISFAYKLPFHHSDDPNQPVTDADGRVVVLQVIRLKRKRAARTEGAPDVQCKKAKEQ